MASLAQFAALLIPIVLKAWAERPPARTGRRAPQPSSGAASPARIPLPGWRAILLDTWREFQEDQIPSVAGSIAYSAVVAFFPAIAAFVSLYGLFADVHEVRQQLTVLSGIVPGEALKLLGGQMVRIAETKQHSEFGVAFVIGLLISLWSANAGMKALMRGLNIAYEEKETRGFLRLNLVSLAMTIAGVVFLIVAAAVVVAAPFALHALHLYRRLGGLDLLRWPALVVMAVFGLAALYRFGPDRAQPRWRWVTPGSLAATVLWLLCSLALSWYISNFGSYNATYGSLGALFGLLTWMWLSALIVLLGAELNCEVERRKQGARPPPRGSARGRTAGDVGGGRR